MYSKKYYQDVAAALKSIDATEQVVKVFVDLFRKDHERFDEVKFRVACNKPRVWEGRNDG